MEQPSSFDLARLAALKEYASLEHELCLLMRNLLGVDDPVAAAVFYQISNTRSRYAIIGRLIGLRPDPKWRAWAKIERWLTPCDTARNHLIHWFEDHYMRVTVTEDGGLKAASAERVPWLRNATRRGSFSADEKRYEAKDIFTERDNFRVAKHIVNRFQLTVWKPEEWPWTDIFQQPAGDLTPVEFLQLLNERGHAARLPPYDR
ncbi:hypothetical protein BrevBR_13115 [Brevundimonas sp. BR2-1]|uniref:hypothetical protein n=1 Tax=Brevundimonas sp. BR2-1 TaxID=3031123 RepID=UPI0030AEC1F7